MRALLLIILVLLPGAARAEVPIPIWISPTALAQSPQEAEKMLDAHLLHNVDLDRYAIPAPREQHYAILSALPEKHRSKIIGDLQQGHPPEIDGTTFRKATTCRQVLDLMAQGYHVIGADITPLTDHQLAQAFWHRLIERWTVNNCLELHHLSLLKPSRQSHLPVTGPGADLFAILPRIALFFDPVSPSCQAYHLEKSGVSWRQEIMADFRHEDLRYPDDHAPEQKPLTPDQALSFPAPQSSIPYRFSVEWHSVETVRISLWDDTFRLRFLARGDLDADGTEDVLVHAVLWPYKHGTHSGAWETIAPMTRHDVTGKLVFADNKRTKGWMLKCGSKSYFPDELQATVDRINRATQQGRAAHPGAPFNETIPSPTE